MQSNTILRSDVGSTEKLMGNNNNLNNNGSPGADIMFQMEDEGLTQLGSVFQSAYQSIVGGGPQIRDPITRRVRWEDFLPPLKQLLAFPETRILIRAAWAGLFEIRSEITRRHGPRSEFRAGGNEERMDVGDPLASFRTQSHGIMVSLVRIMVALCTHDRIIS
ncbi:hypothetical protein ALC56_12240 [Trachymyrmex septentrionalis]|uniref:Uncharacterized protein n=1 Tax=Trachymyrmex septentrionalis TaxID=34720 RepID=A0A195EZ83_9HYME|nr:hypothetical protein ALC56_12240 [Trachymyrmex septentrionalis]